MSAIREWLACLSCERRVGRWLRGPGGIDRCPFCGYDQAITQPDDDDVPCPAAGGVPCGSDDCKTHGCEDQR